MLFYGF